MKRWAGVGATSATIRIAVDEARPRATAKGGRGGRGIHRVVRPVRRVVKVEIHDRLEAIGSGAWDELASACRLRAPFLTWTWQRQWAHAFAEGCRLEIRAVKDPADRLLALLPLYEVQPGLLRIVGGADVSDYLDLIALDGREDEAWTALLQSRAAEPGGAGCTGALGLAHRDRASVASAACRSRLAHVEDRCPCTLPSRGCVPRTRPEKPGTKSSAAAALRA